MSDEDLRKQPVTERPVEQRVPNLSRGLIVDPRVDKGKAVSVLNQIDVDMIEPKRKRKTNPKYARCYLDHLNGLRRKEKWKFKHAGHENQSAPTKV